MHQYHFKKFFIISMVIVLFSAFLSVNIAKADSEKCPQIPVKFATMGWASSQITAEIQRYGIEKTLGCDTIVLEGSTVPMFQALIEGYVDVIPELWIFSVREMYQDAIIKGRIIDGGETFYGSLEGWYIPKYVAEQYPDLKSVNDLKKYAHIFKQENDYTNKALFYSCPIGWSCEYTNKNMMKAFELDDLFNLYSPFVDEILFQQLRENYALKQPFITYMWSPVSVLGELDLVRLEMPSYLEQYFECLKQEFCEKPKPSGYPVLNIHKIINPNLERNHPEISLFVRLTYIPNEVINELLFWMEEEGGSLENIAVYFYRNYPNIWQDWVSTQDIMILQAATALEYGG